MRHWYGFKKHRGSYNERSIVSGAAEDIRERIGAPIWPVERPTRLTVHYMSPCAS